MHVRHTLQTSVGAPTLVNASIQCDFISCSRYQNEKNHYFVFIVPIIIIIIIIKEFNKTIHFIKKI